MTIQEAQQQVDEWIEQYGVRYFDELTNMAILTEEVGEVARIMSRQYGEQNFKDEAAEANANLADELSDVLWVVLCIANQTNINLEQSLKENIKKKTKRDHQRHQANQQLTNNKKP